MNLITSIYLLFILCLLTSTRTKTLDCGVYWPASDEDGHDLVGFSDHRLVWVDIQL